MVTNVCVATTIHSGASISTANIASHVTTNEHWRAEVLWAMKVVSSHYSYVSCTDSDHLLQLMFPDSSIAKSFHCGEKKCAYVVCHGLAPYFSQQLKDQLRLLDSFVILFDESFNPVTQSKQMDIHVRFFDDASCEVRTRYFASAFLGHATAAGMVDVFVEKCTALNLSHMIQLSMDGPNVNWSFYSKLMAEVHDDRHRKLIDIGSCGLHVVHNAFKVGFDPTGWDLKSFLWALHRIFHETPARREDYTLITDSAIFPMKFCLHRWVENARVAARALLMIAPLKKYIPTIIKHPKKYTVPDSKSFSTVKAGCADRLMPARLMYFESMARQFDEFLVRYQTDKPVVPFLCGDLDTLVRELCQRFMKRPVLEEASTTAQLSRLQVDDANTHLPHAKIDAGFCADKNLKELAAADAKVSERDRMAFRMECKKTLVCATQKLLQKCPIAYSMTRNLTCMDPRLMAGNKDDCIAKFGRVLHKLSDLNQVRDADCDSIQWQFRAFLNEVVPTNCAAFSTFDPDAERLDTFLSVHLQGVQFEKLWAVVKKILILSHGQATVERGFSINSQLLVEHLKEESVVAQRIVYDSISTSGGVCSVPITKSMLSYAQAARQKYMAHLDDLKRKRERQVASDAEKLETVENEKRDAKKRRLNVDIDALLKSADELADSAEASGDLTLLSKSNAMRKSAANKREALKDL